MAGVANAGQAGAIEMRQDLTTNFAKERLTASLCLLAVALGVGLALTMYMIGAGILEWPLSQHG